MPLSTGDTGRGVKFEISDIGSPSTWLTVANVTSISVQGRDAEEIEFTHLLSDGGFREYRQGFKDGGTINVEYHFNPEEESHVDLLDRWLSGDNFNWRINFTGGGWDMYLTGVGFVMNPSDLNINVNDPIGGTAVVRITGESTFVAAP